MTGDMRGDWRGGEGLEKHLTCAGNFFHINHNLGSAKACATYYAEWMGKYRRLMRDWDDGDIAAWAVRMRQSLKSAFVATHFALSAREARAAGSLISYYYLAYYAVLHAVWGVLYTHPEEKTAAIARPKHSKLQNVFEDSYCRPNGIINYSVGKIMQDLRYRREYYSYRMPFNSPFEFDEDSKTAHVGGTVKQCIQLSHLQSQLVADAAGRERKSFCRIAPDNITTFLEMFRDFNSQRHPTGQGWFIEPADEQALHEFLERGCGLDGHSITYEHMSDNYMTWSGAGDADALLSGEAASLVYNALF